MKTRKSAIEFETVIVFILILVVLAVLLLLFSKYGGSMYNSLKENVLRAITLSNESVKSLVPQ